MTNLNHVWNERKIKGEDLTSEIERLQSLIKTRKAEWAAAEIEFCKMDHYKSCAKRMNEVKRFEWQYETSRRWRTGSKGGSMDIEKFWYEGIEYKFRIELHHRDELKVWKWEVHVEVEQLAFGNAYWGEYSPSRQRGNAYSKNVEGYKDEVMTKFKTNDEALKQIEKWKNLLEERYKESLDYAKDMYTQACKKYDNVVRINPNWETRNAFRDMIKFYPDILVMDEERTGAIELMGDNVKEVIAELNNKYKLKLEVIAG